MGWGMGGGSAEEYGDIDRSSFVGLRVCCNYQFSQQNSYIFFRKGLGLGMHEIRKLEVQKIKWSPTATGGR